MFVDLAHAPSKAAQTSSLPPRQRPWLRLLSEVLHLAGGKLTGNGLVESGMANGAEFLRHSERPWSSATFCGSRHSVLLSFDGQDAMRRGEAFIAALPDHEFTVPGHLVADATIVAVEHDGALGKMTVEAEFLLLEDA